MCMIPFEVRMQCNSSTYTRVNSVEWLGFSKATTKALSGESELRRGSLNKDEKSNSEDV